MSTLLHDTIEEVVACLIIFIGLTLAILIPIVTVALTRKARRWRNKK